MDGRFVFVARVARCPTFGGIMKTITVQELQQNPDVPLVDVREEHEFVEGRVPGAINLPMSTLGERIDELPEGAFRVVCALGGRSARVVEALEARGYDATNVEGGTTAWAEAGFPLER
jgi:rhodanese-related sulfurtransferase